MYAIVKIGGKQYRAIEGETIVVEKLPYEVGQSVEFADVLLVSDGDQVQVGQPTVSGVTVRAEVLSQFRGKKILVFKYKPKIRYRRRQGHRQYYTRVQVHFIGAGEASEAKPKARSRKKSDE